MKYLAIFAWSVVAVVAMVLVTAGIGPGEYLAQVSQGSDVEYALHPAANIALLAIGVVLGFCLYERNTRHG